MKEGQPINFNEAFAEEWAEIDTTGIDDDGIKDLKQHLEQHGLPHNKTKAQIEAEIAKQQEINGQNFVGINGDNWSTFD